MDSLDSYVLFALVAIPFAWGLAIALFPPESRQAIRFLSVAVSLVLLALSAYVFLGYDKEAAGYQFMREFQWLDSLGIALALGVDGISVPMVFLTGIVTFTGVLISWNISSDMPRRMKDFFVLFFLLVAGVYGVFVSLDLFFLFFFYELAVLPMYLLIGVWGSSSDFGTFLRPKEYGAMKLMLYLVAGSILVWVAILAVYVEGGMGTFSFLKLEEATFSPTFQWVFFPLFMVGFGVLAGLWPFHTWSPDGHVAAPTAVSMLHAGVLMKLGAYGIIRLGIDLLPEGRAGLGAGAHRPGHHQRRLRRGGRYGTARPQVRCGLLKRQPHGIRTGGIRHAQLLWIERRCAPDVLPRHYDGPLLRSCGRHLRPRARPGHRRP